MKRIVAMLFAVCLCLTATANVSYAENWQEIYQDADGRILIDVDSAKKIRTGVYRVWERYEDDIYGGAVSTRLVEYSEDTRAAFIENKKFFGDYWFAGYGKEKTDVLSVGTKKCLEEKSVEGTIVPKRGGKCKPKNKNIKIMENYDNTVYGTSHADTHVLAYLNQTLGDKHILKPEMKWYHSTDTTTYTYNASSIVYRNSCYYVWTRGYRPMEKINPSNFLIETNYEEEVFELKAGNPAMIRKLRSYWLDWIIPQKCSGKSMSVPIQSIEDQRLYEAVVAEYAVRHKQ